MPDYLALAASTPSSSSPYHPFHHDRRLTSSVPPSSLPLLRRALFFLSWAIRLDSALLALRRPLSPPLMRLAHRVLSLAGLRYMAARVAKALDAGGDEVPLPHVSDLPPHLRARFPALLQPASATHHMTADDARRLSAELEALTTDGAVDEEELQPLLLASLHGCDGVGEEEVEAVATLLPLVAQKLEVNSDSERDRVVRWRVMDLASALQRRMEADGVELEPLLADELLRVYAACAAIEPALALFNRLQSPDLLAYQHLIRCASLLQRWEGPDAYAMEALGRMRRQGLVVPQVVYNDVLRAVDRGERWELVRRVVEEMRADGLEGNDVTWQYVGQAAAAAGEREQVGDWMGKEGVAEAEADVEAVDDMTVEDFFPELADGDAQEGGEAVERKREAEAVLGELKAKMKAEMREDLPTVR